MGAIRSGDADIPSAVVGPVVAGGGFRERGHSTVISPDTLWSVPDLRCHLSQVWAVVIPSLSFGQSQGSKGGVQQGRRKKGRMRDWKGLSQ